MIREIAINANAFFLRSESGGKCMGLNIFITSPILSRKRIKESKKKAE
jgi:hypothetical protein